MSNLNDPRVLFAAERTLLAWTRTALALMGFGFLVERFGLFLHGIYGHQPEPLHRGISLFLGVTFILIGVLLLLISVRQYRGVVATLGAGEIPENYWVNSSALINLAVAVLGLVLAAYLALV